MICKNCGKELTESSTFCSECGMQQDVQEAVPNLSATQSSSSGASVVPSRKKTNHKTLKNIIFIAIGTIFLIGCIGVGTSSPRDYQMKAAAYDMSSIESKGYAESGSRNIDEAYNTYHGAFLGGYADFLKGFSAQIGNFILLIGILGGGLTITKGIMGLWVAKKDGEVQ